MKLRGISGSDFIGFGNFAIATKSQSSSYNPMAVINGVRNDPVESTEELKS